MDTIIAYTQRPTIAEQDANNTLVLMDGLLQDTMQYFMCTRKLTRLIVSLIYCTEPENRKSNGKPTTENQVCSEKAICDNEYWKSLNICHKVQARKLTVNSRWRSCSRFKRLDSTSRASSKPKQHQRSLETSTGECLRRHSISTCAIVLTSCS